MQPESGGYRAHNRAERIPRVGAAHRGPAPAPVAERGPAISTTTAGKLNPKTTAVGSIASALVTNWASTRPRNDSCVARRIGGSTSIRRVKNTRKASAASAVSVCVTAKVIEPGTRRAAPSFKQRAPQNDSREERAEHQRERVRGAAQLRREQARPADFVGHGRSADDCETNQEKS